MFTVNKGKKAIRKVAKENGVTVEHVREEMQIAILEAYNKAETKEMWNELFGEGVLPTPEQFITVMTKRVAQE